MLAPFLNGLFLFQSDSLEGWCELLSALLEFLSTRGDLGRLPVKILKASTLVSSFLG